MVNFISEENLRMLMNISQKYMMDKFAYVIPDDKFLRQIAYNLVMEVAEETHGKNVSFEKKNILVLNNIKEYYVSKYNLSPMRHSEKPIAKIIEQRDTDLYGPQKPKPSPPPSNKEVPEDNESFMKKLRELEEQRGKELAAAAAAAAATPSATFHAAVPSAPATFHVVAPLAQNNKNLIGNAYSYSLDHKNVYLRYFIVPECDFIYSFFNLYVNENYFCRLIFHKDFVCRGRRYIMLDPEEHRIVSQDSIMLQVKDPRGKLLESSNECGILNVHQKDKMLLIELEHAAHLCAEDVILIQDFRCDSISMTEYLNRAEGHLVVDVKDKIIYIHALGEGFLFGRVSGKLINVALQNSLSFVTD